MRHQYKLPLKTHFTSYSHSRKDIDKVMRVETEPSLQKHFSFTSKVFNSNTHFPNTFSLDQDLPPINQRKYAPERREEGNFLIFMINM